MCIIIARALSNAIIIDSQTFQMRNQQQFKDRFSEYLNRRLEPNKFTQLDNQRIQQQNSIQCVLAHESQNSNNYCLQSPSQSSIDSSQFDFSQSARRSHHSNSNAYSNCKTTSMKKRKLRKARDIEQNVCSICLEEYRDQVEMSCRHSYCRACLEEWLKTSSRCPYCRAECEFYVHEGVKHKIEQKVYEHEPMEVDEGLDFECYMCERTQEGDQVLICDRCEMYACHMRCDPRLRGVVLDDEEQWYCHFCS